MQFHKSFVTFLSSWSRFFLYCRFKFLEFLIFLSFSFPSSSNLHWGRHQVRSDSCFLKEFHSAYSTAKYNIKALENPIYVVLKLSCCAIFDSHTVKTFSVDSPWKVTFTWVCRTISEYKIDRLNYNFICYIALEPYFQYIVAYKKTRGVFLRFQYFGSRI